MTAAISAREEILARIRSAGTKNTEDAAADYARADYERIERSYRQAARLSRVEILDLFEKRLHEYGARVFRVSEAQLAGLCAELLRERGARRIVIPAGLPKERHPGAESAAESAPEFVPDAGFDAAELDGFDSVITASTLAIAETGTIVLASAPDEGRRAITLVPDYHLCVVREGDVVETVVEGMRRLDAVKEMPLTLISGPSATADIEMTRIKGVHGPRFLDVAIVSAVVG
jgi:L-lactate dehydrogenase complex protein LldG